MAMRTLPTDELLATTLRAIGDAVISCDRDGRVVLMNAEAERLTAWSQAEATDHHLKEVFVIVNETTRATVEDPVDKVFRLGKVVGMANHTLLLRRDGTEVAIDDSAAPVVDDAGELRGVVLVFRDVSARRAAERNLELLAASGRVLGEAREVDAILERVGTLAARSFADVVVFDFPEQGGGLRRVVGEHRVPEMRPVMEEVGRFVPAWREPRHPLHGAIEEARSTLVAEFSEEVLRGWTTEEEHRRCLRERARYRSLLVVPVVADGRSMGAMTFIRNVTAWRFGEADRATGQELGARLGVALRYAELRAELETERARTEALLESAPVGVLVADRQGRIVRGNVELDRVLGRDLQPSESTMEYGERNAFHVDGRPLAATEYPMARAIAGGETVRGEELRFRRGDGSMMWINVSAAPIRTPEGELVGGVVTVQDIDRVKEAEAGRQRSEDRLRLLVERASVGLATASFDGSFTMMNPMLLGLLEYTREEVEGGSVRWQEITPERFVPRDLQAVEELRARGAVVPYEKELITKGGRRLPVQVGAVKIPGLTAGGEEEIAVFYTDLTTLRQTEAALLQTEKLAAVGKLASTISHEINNPLEAVTNLLYIVRQDETTSAGTRDYLDTADRELQRVSQVVSQTLRFHRQSTAPMQVRPEALVDEVLQIYAARLHNAEVEVVREYGPGVRVVCYEGDIRQVLNNVIGNAFDAMRTGGRLTVRTREAKRWSTGEPGVRVTVADTGVGMTAEVQRHMFEAFYTTKGIHGTGLGLWISCRIMHKHRGYARVYSSRSQGRRGTVLSLWLPKQLAVTAGDPWHLDA